MDTSPSLEMSPLCFINRLPTETLEAIFIQRAHDYFRGARGHPIPVAPSWVNISYVSRRWRNVALNCSALWTYLFVTSPRWTEELLVRSKQVSLKIDVNADGQDEERRVFRFLEQATDHIERIQEFSLVLAIAPQHPFLSKLCSRALRLSHLEITIAGYCSDSCSLFFDGDPPALRTLHLVHCPMSLYPLKLSGLTKLNLRQVPALSRQDTAEFLAMLGRMQDLHYLYLDNALTTATGLLSSAAFRSFQKINLPHLSQLLILDRLSTVIALLSCINIPSETEVRLGPDFLYEHNSPLDEYTQLFLLLEQRYGTSQDPAPSIPTIRSLVIAYSESPLGCVELSFRTSERDVNSCICASCPNWSRGIPLQISLAHRQPISDRMHFLNRICYSMPLSHVQSVHVLDPPLSVAFWKEALGRLPSLRYLKLSEGFMPNLASILSLPPHNFTENKDGHAFQGPDHVFAPALQELELDSISFSAAVISDGNSDIPFGVTDYQSLSDALSTRTERQGRLTVTRCVERASDRRLKVFDLDGWWGGDQLYIVSSKDDYYEDDEDEVDEEEGEEEGYYYADYWNEGDEEEPETRMTKTKTMSMMSMIQTISIDSEKVF